MNANIRKLALFLAALMLMLVCAGCGGGSGSLSKSFDKIGRAKTADDVLAMFKGTTMRENNVNYGSYNRTEYVALQLNGVKFTQVYVDYAPDSRKLKNVKMVVKQSDLNAELEKMVKDGFFVKTSSGYTCAPQDGAYTITITESSQLILMDRVWYYDIVITQ